MIDLYCQRIMSLHIMKLSPIYGDLPRFPWSNRIMCSSQFLKQYEKPPHFLENSEKCEAYTLLIVMFLLEAESNAYLTRNRVTFNIIIYRSRASSESVCTLLGEGECEVYTSDNCKGL